ncbi:uncharacterized protein LOC127735158 [Mytilus californianus]|uniref:uncharacterized protein LOC127735158 n=1 Tax=Mytilus californianus TaxID=6549 RepID=UPI002245BF59|nr:uncharacterized protein LOC127735158 [Mytilus californianus]XP_052101220.1 uncharacterized protein LOC127735158 [Mytilus californianus]
MATSVHCDPCLRNELSSKAVKVCTECEEAMCQLCVKAHQSFKAFTSHHLVNVDVLPQSVFTSKQYCQIHTEKVLDLFCTQHDTLCCRSCMTNKHRNCDSVLPLEDASRNVDKSAILVDTKCELDGIADTLRIFEKDRKSASSEVDDSASIATSEVTNLKDRILKRIDEMEENIITEIEDMKTKHFFEINSTHEEIKEMKEMIDRLKQNLESTTKFGSNNQKFVMIHSLKTKIKELQDRLQHLLLSTRSVGITFSPTMDILPSTKFGLIKENRKPCTIVHHISTKMQAPIVPRKSSTFKLTKEFNPIGSIITSAVIIPKNKLLVCFFNESALGVIDEDGIIIKIQKIQSNPWSIAIIPDTDEAIAILTRERSIQYVKIENLALEKKVSVKEKFPCELRGIAVTKDRIAFGGHGKVYLCNMNLDLITQLNVDSFTVYHLHFDNTDRLCCVFKVGRVIYRFLKTEKLSMKYSLKDFQSLCGITSDKYGNLLIADTQTNSIIEVGSKGEYHKQILKGGDGINNPKTIIFNKTFTKLYIFNTNGSVQIYDC